MSQGVIDREGFALVPGLIDQEVRLDLLRAVTAAPVSGVAGVRNLLDVVPLVRYLARSEPVRRLVEPLLGARCFAVRGLLFDKTPAANWKVPWHQDVSIAVKERCEVPGFGPWSVKAGVVHVQAPASLLERMLAVRVHLDDCGPANGPLRVLAGSHLAGRLSQEEIREWTRTGTPTECVVQAGGGMAMRPLLLHASSVASRPEHRRVIHIEFAGVDLPDGLRWYSQY